MKKIICTLLALIMALSAICFAVSADEVMSAGSLPIGEITGEIMTGRAPQDVPYVDDVTRASDTEAAGKGDTFLDVYAGWRVFGYPENVAGVTRDRVTDYGGELIVSFTTNEYTVLVTDDSPEAIERIRTWKSDGNGIKVNFAKTVTGYSGAAVTMKYSYDELAVVANSIIGDILDRNEKINVNGSERTAVFAQIEELSNRVVIALYNYVDADGSIADAETTKAVAKFYREKYALDSVVIREIKSIISTGIGEITSPVWETGRAPSDYPVQDDKRQPELYPVRGGDSKDAYGLPGSKKTDVKFLYIAVALLAAFVIPAVVLYVRRRRAELLAVAGGGTHTSASAPSEKEILKEISSVAEKPDDGLYDRIMRDKKN